MMLCFWFVNINFSKWIYTLVWKTLQNLCIYISTWRINHDVHNYTLKNLDQLFIIPNSKQTNKIIPTFKI